MKRLYWFRKLKYKIRERVVAGCWIEKQTVYILPTISVYKSESDSAKWFNISFNFLVFVGDVTVYYKRKCSLAV